MNTLFALAITLLSTASAHASQTPEVYCSMKGSATSVAILVDSADGSRKSLNYKIAGDGKYLVDTRFSVTHEKKNAESATYETTYMDLIVSRDLTRDGYAAQLKIRTHGEVLRTNLYCGFSQK